MFSGPQYGVLLPFLVGPLVYRFYRSSAHSDTAKRRIITIAGGAFLLGMLAPLKVLAIFGWVALAGVGIFLVVLRDIKSSEEK